MANSLKSLFLDIATAIRNKNGSSDTYKPNQMADAISSIETKSDAVYQSKKVTPSESEQIVKADSSYDGLSEVEVEAISSTYIGSGVTRKSVATYTPTTTDQTIASGVYLLGAQTIAGDANLISDNIISGRSIFGVPGNVVIQNYYTGSDAPSSSMGNDGDIYLQE